MQVMSRFIRLTKGLSDRGILIKPEEVQSHIKDINTDYYTSTFFYDEKQLEQFKQKGGSVKGIREVKTNFIWWDFDHETNPELARKDALELVKRLKVVNIKDEAIQVYFSGNKGYNVVLTLNREITPKQVANLALYKFGKDLKTLDHSMYDPVQILRVPFTKHPKTGLFKVPLKIEELEDNDTTAIKEYASNIDHIAKIEYETVQADDDFYITEEIPQVEIKKEEIGEYIFDIKNKPRGWKMSKWAIAQGYFEPGERNEAMMILASTCRALGYDKLAAYYTGKGSLEKHMIRTGRKDKFNKEELWGIVDRVFSDGWEGGQYSDDHPVLKKIIERLGLPTNEKSPITKLDKAFDLFTDYAQNIERLTVKTGIKELDDKVRMTIGMSVGIIAAPGVGKTSLALQMLNNMSKEGHRSIIFSYDMFHSLVIQKLVQKHMKLSPNVVFEKFKAGDVEFKAQCREIIEKEYGNVDFCFEAGQTIDQVKKTIEESEQTSGKPVRFIVVDYNELVVSEISDPTQSSAFVAQKMREIANTYNLCVLSLFQPSKMSGSPSDELTSYRSAKGSSAIEQSVSVMFGISRPGFNPRKPEDDKYITINCVKNRMGGVFALDLHWDGMAGTVRSLTVGEKVQLDKMREDKAAKEDNNWG